MVWRYACDWVFFFRILKLFFITGFLLQYLGKWYRTNGPLVKNFTIFNTSNKNKAGDINSPWNLLVFYFFAKKVGNSLTTPPLFKESVFSYSPDLALVTSSQLPFYVNLHKAGAVIGPSATLTGRWRPDIDLRRMLTGFLFSETEIRVCVTVKPVLGGICNFANNSAV